jgi:hypothetical protein
MVCCHHCRILSKSIFDYLQEQGRANKLELSPHNCDPAATVLGRVNCFPSSCPGHLVHMSLQAVQGTITLKFGQGTTWAHMHLGNSRSDCPWSQPQEKGGAPSGGRVKTQGGRPTCLSGQLAWPYTTYTNMNSFTWSLKQEVPALRQQTWTVNYYETRVITGTSEESISESY